MSEGLGELTSVMDQIGGIVRYAFPFGFGKYVCIPETKIGRVPTAAATKNDRLILPGDAGRIKELRP